MLKIDGLKVSYGGIEAVKGITFEVPERQIVTLIGANGAGKSTTLRSIAGLVKPAKGRIHLQGEDITSLSPDRIVSKGITLVPEGRHVFPDLTVLENLKIGAYLRNDDLEDDLKWVYDLFPRLKERSWQAAGTLSGGEQQMLAVGRALMSRPKIMMMDEPSLGLAPLVVKGIFDIIKEINKQGVTILLVEQNANMALKTADLGYVLETGRITMTGAGKELLKNEDVKNALDDEGSQTQRRFVHHEQLGAAHEGSANCQHLLLAAGEGTAGLPGTLLKTGEQVVHPVQVFSQVIVSQISTDFQILQNRHVRENPASFRNQGNALRHDQVGILGGDVLAQEGNAAGAGLDQTSNGAKGGALTGTVGTDQGHDLTLGNVQADALNGFNAAIVDLQVPNFQNITHLPSLPNRPR